MYNGKQLTNGSQKTSMEIPSCCPHCDEPYRWEVSLQVDQELAWMAPGAPAFTFVCTNCQGRVEVAFEWGLERGSAPRRLTLAGGPTPLHPQPRILLVAECPHGCGSRLGLQLEPDDPWALGVVWPDESRVLGGYRCPGCDGEGRLRIQPLVRAADSAEANHED